MGTCETFCSRQDIENQIQPDTEKMSSRSYNTAFNSNISEISSTTSTTIQSATYRYEDVKTDLHTAIRNGSTQKIVDLRREYPDIDLMRIKYKDGNSCLIEGIHFIVIILCTQTKSVARYDTNC